MNQDYIDQEIEKRFLALQEEFGNQLLELEQKTLVVMKDLGLAIQGNAESIQGLNKAIRTAILKLIEMFK